LAKIGSSIKEGKMRKEKGRDQILNRSTNIQKEREK